MDYVKDIEQLEITFPELNQVKDRLLDNLQSKQVSIEEAFQDVDTIGIPLSDYWKSYGHNYDIIPELQQIPYYIKAVERYIRVTYDEKLLLVKSFVDLLETINAIKKKKIEEKQKKADEKSKKRTDTIVEKKLEDIEKEMEKKIKKRKKKTKPKIEIDKEVEEGLEKLEKQNG